MRKAKVDINNDKLNEASETLRALAHPLRLKILEFIDQYQTINVNKIYNTMKLEQSITSQHLRILRIAGIVQTNREGKFIHYSIDYDKISTVLKALNTFESNENNETESDKREETPTTEIVNPADS